MGEAEEGCSFSLMCLEDGADLDGGLADSAGEGKILLLYGGAEGEQDDEEYMDHLVSKESSFCCSPSTSSSSPSSPAFSDFSDAGTEPSPSPMASSEDWFRCARRDTVKWILEVCDRALTRFPSFTYLHFFPHLLDRRHCRPGLASASPTARRTWPSPTSTASASTGAST
jgi:hypothetical protein